MLKTNYRCVQSLNISVDVAKCVENVQKFTQFTHFLSVTKNDLSWLNNLFMANFQLSRMSSYAKNKLQMCSVTQHQCRRRQMCENVQTFIHYTHFWTVTKNVVLLNNLFRGLYIPLSWYVAVNRLFSQDKSFFCNRQVSALVEFLNILHTFGAIYTDVEWVNTSVVCF